MNKTELSKTLKVSRMTIDRWDKQGVLKDKIAEHWESNVTHNVTPDKNVTPDVTLDVTFSQNWEKNKNPITNKPFTTKEEAIATAIGMVTKEGSTIMLNGEVYTYKK